jgi:hypothetical protein
MPSNSLSKRRGNARRPPVCKKPPPPRYRIIPPGQTSPPGIWLAWYVDAYDPALPVGTPLPLDINLDPAGEYTINSPLLNDVPAGVSTRRFGPASYKVICNTSWPTGKVSHAEAAVTVIVPP